MKKKPVIRDYIGNRVLIETIAAYKDDGATGVKVFLRSDAIINMHWQYRNGKNAALKILDSHFDVSGEEKHEKH